MWLKVTLAGALLLGGACAVPDVDRDRDGIPDPLEAALARDLFPVLHIAADAEKCPEPVNPKPVLFRARHVAVGGVRDESLIAINYVLLYDNDCGDAAHRGDNEALVVFAKRSGRGYIFDSMSATAHANTAAEVRTATRHRDLFIEANKHANYAPAEGCASCPLAGAEWQVRLINVGEPNAPLVTDLREANPAYAGINPWDEDRLFFSAGRIAAESLRLTHFDYLTRPGGAAAARWDDN